MDVSGYSPNRDAIHEASNGNRRRESDHGWEGTDEDHDEDNQPASRECSPTLCDRTKPVEDRFTVDKKQDAPDGGDDHCEQG